MKIVTLCSRGSCCPVVKLADDHIEIGEEGNLCILSTAEWETLKNKISCNPDIIKQTNKIKSNG